MLCLSMVTYVLIEPLLCSIMCVGERTRSSFCVYVSKVCCFETGEYCEFGAL